jgi:hypothetical protein
MLLPTDVLHALSTILLLGPARLCSIRVTRVTGEMGRQ